MSTALRFVTLRNANAARLPQFKNAKGKPAHSKPDGSDWSPAQWLQAFIGEIGEWCELRIKFERGELNIKEFTELSAKELADIQIYFDIFASRSLDGVVENTGEPTTAGQLMSLMADLGAFANLRKKLVRGDFEPEEYMEKTEAFLPSARAKLEKLACLADQNLAGKEYGDTVDAPDISGVDLTQAVQNKFNEVSIRVKSDVRIYEDRIRFFEPNEVNWP